ncbi:MAG: hypothetical protein CUN56_13670 [Phototrophicales bacterium]|nr:MAG: hypothetical protein CUN56_13670 [Phototrophicales bacterium]RMG69632.1 MAG: hypothetical protein D6711_19060 [Chloroflexota bacterium]
MTVLMLWATLWMSVLGLPEDLLVTWITIDGDLYVWYQGEARLIASGEVSQVAVSAAGDVAYVQNGALWLWQGEVARLVLPSINIAQMTWVNGRLYFKEYEQLAPSDELYEVDLQTGEVNLVAGGGWIAQNGVRILPGDYETGRNGTIVFEEAVLTFPPVATGSHAPFYPDVQQIDLTTIRVAIPTPDALYHEVDSPPVALWELTPTKARQIGTVAARYFGLPIWTADYLAYLGWDNTLYMARADGTQPRQIATDIWTYLWVEDTLVYLEPDGLYLVSFESPPRLWLDVVPIQIQVVGAGILLTLMDGVYYVPLGGELQPVMYDPVIVSFGLILDTR